MFTRLIACTAAVMVCLTCIIPSHAEDITGRWGVEGNLAATAPAGPKFTGDAENGGWGAGLSVRYGNTENGSLALSYDDLRVDDGVQIQPVTLNGVYTFWPKKRLSPVVRLGLGEASLGKEYRFDNFAAHIGGGLEYFLNRDWSLSALANYYLVSIRDAAEGSPREIQAATLGLTLSYFFPPRRERSTGPRPEKSITLAVLFESDKVEINPQYMRPIEQLANYMKKHPNFRAEIEGHTDNTGAEENNISLSQGRAESIKNALVEKYGIDASRIEAVGYGSSRPIASNDTEQGRAKNRRVVSNIFKIAQ